MSWTAIIDNPPARRSSRRRTRRTRRPMTALQKKYFGKRTATSKGKTMKKRRSSRRKTAVYFNPPKRARRTRRRSHGMSRPGFFNASQAMTLAKNGALGAGGLVVAAVATNKIAAALNKDNAPDHWTNQELPRAGMKLALGVIAYGLARRFAPQYAAPIAAGFATSAALDVYTHFKPATAPGIAGLFGPDDTVNYMTPRLAAG